MRRDVKSSAQGGRAGCEAKASRQVAAAIDHSRIRGSEPQFTGSLRTWNWLEENGRSGISEARSTPGLVAFDSCSNESHTVVSPTNGDVDKSHIPSKVIHV